MTYLRQHNLATKTIITIIRLMVISMSGSVFAGPKGAVGDLYVANDGSNVVNQYDGITGALVGTFTSGQVNGPRDITFGPNGNLYVVNFGAAVVEYNGSTGDFIRFFVQGRGNGQESMVFTPSGTVLVSQFDNNQIDEFDGTTGDFIQTFATNIRPFQNSMIIGPNGNLFVGDTLSNSVHQFKWDGTDLGIFASGGALDSPEGIAFGGPKGNLFVASYSNDSVVEFDGVTGTLIGTFASVLMPDGLRFGPNGYLWISSVGSNQIDKYNCSTGEILLSITDGVVGPRAITFKPSPTNCLAMTVSTLTAGQNASWNVSGATPRSKVAVVYGLKAGSTVVSGQMNFCATFGIKGVSQSKLIGIKTADGSGNASIMKKLPGSVRGLTVLTQAAEQNTCPDECVSNLDTQIVQ